MAEDQDKQEAIDAAEAIIGRRREMLSIEGKVIPIAKQLSELGFNACSIKRLEFDPKIPDPDLQIEAIMEISSATPEKKSLQEGAKLLAQDFAMYSTMRFSEGEEFRLEDGGDKTKDRWIIRPREGTPHTLATIEEGSKGISIVFPRTEFYGDKVAQAAHRKMADKLEEYHAERLAPSISLINQPNPT